jgi:hypothetical protein
MNHSSQITTSSLFDRAPPHDLELERLLLGALFVTPSRKVILGIAVEDFYLGAAGWHGYVYATLRRMSRKRGCTTRDVIGEIIADKQSALVRGVRNAALELYSLFYFRRDRRVWSICGIDYQIPYYVAKLRDLRTRRDRIDAAINRLQEAWK